MTTQTLHGPGELIAAIPMMLGYLPHESVVVIALSSRGEIVATMRVDRADLMMSDIAMDAVRTVGAQLRRVGARRAVIVTFTYEDVTLGCDGANAMRTGILDVVDDAPIWSTDGVTYRSPGCAEPHCCPAEGTALPGCQATVWDPRRSLRVSSIATGAGLSPAQTYDRRRASRAGDRWWSRRDGREDQWRSAALATLLESMHPNADALTLGRAVVSLRDVRVRDALMVSWLEAPPEVVAEVLADERSERVAHVLDAPLHDPHQRPPSEASLRRVLQWCDRMAVIARRRDRAAIHSLAAVVHWYAGDFDAAEDAAECALACDDGYSLAGLVAAVCAAGLEPAWLRW
jgi:hypothetical protein